MFAKCRHAFKAAMRLVRDDSGSTIPLVAVATPVIIMIAALVVDLGYASVVGTRLQGTADFAALAAVKKLPDQTAASEQAIAYAIANMPVNAHGNVLVLGDITFGNWNSGTRTFTPNLAPINAVRTVTRRTKANGNQVDFFMAKVIGNTEMDISRASIAITATNDGPCVLSLKTTGNGIFANSGGEIVTTKCDVHSNSPTSDSIVTNGGSISAHDAEICAVGNFSGGGYSPAPTSGCAPTTDPLASLTPPTIGGCDHSDKVEVNNGETSTLSPGRYCNGIVVNSGGIANFQPGTYIIEGDKFLVNSGSTASGSGVTFYMRDKDALINFNSNSHVNFSAPVSGEFAGVVIYADRDVAPGIKHEVNSNSSSLLNGAVYIPASELMINSASTMGGAAGSCTTYIVGNLYVNSDSILNVNNDFAACRIPNAAAGNAVRLVR